MTSPRYSVRVTQDLLEEDDPQYAVVDAKKPNRALALCSTKDDADHICRLLNVEVDAEYIRRIP